MELLALAVLVFLGVVTAVAVAAVLTVARLSALRKAVEDLRLRVAALEDTRRQPAVETAAPPLSAPVELPSVEPPPVVTSRPVVEQPPVREAATDSLETRIGGQWLLYAGVFAILLGIAYFEKLAFENAWLSESARVLQGAIAGGLLVYFGARFARAGYRLYGHAIEGSGFAALYVSAYASFNYYHLVSRPTAFALMTAITAAGVWTADRQRSQGLAVVAVGGGFLTPFLLPGTTDTHVALFGYDAILVGGTTLLARRREWSLVYITSYLSTLLTVTAWADRFYTPDKYLSTEIFLSIFCAMFLYILRQCRRATDDARQIAALVLLSAPVAYYAGSLIVLWDHGGPLLLWCVLVMTAGAIASIALGALTGFIAWLAVSWPLLAWSLAHVAPRWQVAGLAAAGGIYGIALFAELHAAARRSRPGAAEIVWMHGNGLVSFGVAYLFIALQHAALTGTAAAVFAVWQFAIAAWLTRTDRREHAAHFVALGMTLVAIAVALQFDGPAVTTGWAAEAFIAVTLGYRQDRRWLRAAAVGLFVIAAIRMEWLLFAPRAVGGLVALNPRALAAAFVIAVAYGIAAQHARHATGPSRSRVIAFAIIAAQILTLSLVTSEIDAYWTERGDLRVRELMRSVAWAMYGTALILVGLRKDYAPVRIFAIVVLGATVLKVLVVDLSHLERVYRVLSVIGVGIMLLVASYLYQRSRRGTGIGSTARNGNAGGPAA